MKILIIIFYTSEPKPMEKYHINTEGMVRFIARINELTKHKAKYAVYELGECVADFSWKIK